MILEESNNVDETEMDEFETQEARKKDKLDNFQFDQIVKKKKVVKKKQVQSNKKKVVYKPFKYGRNQFDDLNALSQFLLREYHNIEKHASILLSDKEFIEWLKAKSKDEEQFKEWVENIL